MREEQKRVIKLLDSATPKGELEDWPVGYIPKHYKRLSISMDEAVELAEIGYAEAYANFSTDLYFTQSLIFGAVVSGRYKKFTIVTPSQYGKSFVLAQIAIYRAYNGYKFYVAGADADVSEIIMGHVMHLIQGVNAEVKSKLISVTDKLERLETSLSKKMLAFKGAGRIEAITLGENFKNKSTGNKAIGRGGDFGTDEASNISANTRAEMGRSEFASKDGEKFLNIEISNPHQAGEFMDDLMGEVVDEDHLVIWMDARTALEEDNYKSKKQITSSKFFKNKSTCKRYLLCELEDYSEESLFGEPVVDDTPIDQLHDRFYIGLDSAYKGKDELYLAMSCLSTDNTVRLIDAVPIYKGEWIDGVTSLKVIKDVLIVIKKYHVKEVCVDVGYGVWLIEGLVREIKAQGIDCKVVGINFGSSPTKERVKANMFPALFADNMRAELHLDLQSFMDDGRITFTSDVLDACKEQMNAVRAIRKTNGKTAIIPKDDIKRAIGRSPDALDAVLLSIHALILDLLGGGVWLYQD